MWWMIPWGFTLVFIIGVVISIRAGSGTLSVLLGFIMTIIGAMLGLIFHILFSILPAPEQYAYKFYAEI